MDVKEFKPSSNGGHQTSLVGKQIAAIRVKTRLKCCGTLAKAADLLDKKSVE